MADQRQIDLLRRMVGRETQDVAESPLTSSRAVRMALIKAAEDSVGLNLTVTSVSETILPLEELLSKLSDEQMLVGLHRNTDAVGVFVLDTQMRSAILEMRTIGAVEEKPVEPRPATGTDKRLSDPLLATLMRALPNAVIGTEFEGWLDGVRPLGLVPSVKAAGLTLPDKIYRRLCIKVSFGASAREGEIMLCLPLTSLPDKPTVDVASDVDWDTAFQASVSEAALTLTAELHHFALPLRQAYDLKVDQLLPLVGCTVSSVKLRASDGQVVQLAKLGQSGGKRAIRIEPAALPQMGELTPTIGTADMTLSPDIVPPDDLPQSDGITSLAED